MAVQYSNLEELRRKKEILKQEVRDLEDLLTFKEPRESLSVMTNGLTDYYLKSKVTADGDTRLGLNTGNILKDVSEKIKDSVTKNSVLHFATSESGIGTIDTLVKAGVVGLVGNIAQKNLIQKGWKNKALGLALVYLAPIAIKMIEEKLSDYQKHKTTASLEQLI